MIKREEIQEKSHELGVNTINVQRDYVFGWLLFAIYQSPELKDVLILKGGNCLRKAYFEHTRFSGDLDFATERAINPAQLKAALDRASLVVQEACGVRFETEESRIEEGWSPDKSLQVYKVRLYFHDFFGNREEVRVTIRMDVTEFDKIYLPLQTRNLIHSYSDQRDCTVALRCLSIEEALGTKLKCLLQRKHIADLYDFAYGIFVAQELSVDRMQVAEVFFKKTIFGSSPKAAASILTGLPLEKLEWAWDKFIVCPKVSILGFTKTIDEFRGFISQMFGAMPNRVSEFAFFPPELRNPIMEAGSSLTLLNVNYDGMTRLIEPYSLVFKRRKDGVGQEYLYAYDRSGGRSGAFTIKSFLASGFHAMENTEEKFDPRVEVSICKAGEPGDALYFGSQSPFYKQTRSKGRATRSKSHGWTFVIQCPYCMRKFNRKSRRVTLNPHKDRFGNKCYGKRGTMIQQTFN